MLLNNSIMNVDLSFVLLEYHSINEVEEFHKALTSNLVYQKYNCEIIVSSNSEYDLSRQLELKERYTNIIWVFNSRNEGFASGMNGGLRVTRGEYLIISNTDVRLRMDISPMVEFMVKNSNIGALAPVIVDKDNNIQDSCREYITPVRFAKRQLSRFLSKKEVLLDSNRNYAKVQTVDWVIGAFIMVRREAYMATKGLDTSYFLYVEDMDWCTRIRKSGFEIVYYPKIQIEYKGTRSARKSKKYAKIFMQGLFRYWKKFGLVPPRRKVLIFD